MNFFRLTPIEILRLRLLQTLSIIPDMLLSLINRCLWLLFSIILLCPNFFDKFGHFLEIFCKFKDILNTIFILFFALSLFQTFTKGLKDYLDFFLIFVFHCLFNQFVRFTEIRWLSVVIKLGPVNFSSDISVGFFCSITHWLTYRYITESWKHRCDWLWLIITKGVKFRAFLWLIKVGS